jgi:hypothetical protein
VLRHSVPAGTECPIKFSNFSPTYADDLQFVEDYQNKWSAQPWYFEEDWRLEHLPTGKEGYKMAMKATFNTILLGLPAAEGATLIEKISLIGSKTVTKNGAGKMIDKIN